MKLGPKRAGAAEVALRLMARRGRGDWLVLVVEAGHDPLVAAEELAHEMELLGEEPVDRIIGAQDTRALSSSLASTPRPVVVGGLDDWPAPEWASVDHLRSRLARGERTALVVTSSTFEHIMREAPNFSSWLGASTWTYQPGASQLTEEEQARRLEALRAWSGLSDAEVIERADLKELPAEPEFAEWLVLLGRGDLLER